jgi:hypothetical protein
MPSATQERSMRVTELAHVVDATEGFDRRGRILRIVTDLPIGPEAPGHNAEKLRGLEKAIERIRATGPYLKYDHFELTNEGAPRRASSPQSERRAKH